jgi:hypothetical protein
MNPLPTFLRLYSSSGPTGPKVRRGERSCRVAAFSQNGKFKLVSDRLVQKGPSFEHPIETSLDVASGQVTYRYTDDDGKEKTADEHMSLPDDVAIGLLFTLLRHIEPAAPQTVVS